MKLIDWKNWGVLKLVWGSKGLNNKEVAHRLQQQLKRKGFSRNSVQRNADLRLPAPPDVVDAVRDLEVKPKFEDTAEIVRLGLEVLERGPVVDPDELAANLQAKLPLAGPDAIAEAVTAKMLASDDLVQKLVAGVVARQPDASKAVADALAQAPKPPSADEVAAKVEATLAQHPKKIARYVARYLGQRNAKPAEPLNTKQLGEEIAQQVSESLPAPKVDERKIAAAVVRGLVPWFAVGVAGLLAGVWIFLHLPSQHGPTERQPDDHFTSEQGEDTDTVLALGQDRLPLLEGQERPPCQGPSQEQDGGCWFVLEHKPPCGGRVWEKRGKCWVPVMVGKRRPPQAGDGKQSPPPAENPR